MNIQEKMVAVIKVTNTVCQPNPKSFKTQKREMPCLEKKSLTLLTRTDF